MFDHALDPKVQAVIDAIGDRGRIDLAAMPLEEAVRVVRPNQNPGPPPAHSEDHLITGFEGREIRVRLYFPELRSAKLPVLLYLHGGGFVSGAAGMDNARSSQIAAAANCIVADVDYHLAPEHSFPVAIEDAFAAWRWLMSFGQTFGGDNRTGAISGSSSGAHIAVGVLLLARERGAPMPRLQLLINPVLDPSQGSASYRAFSDVPLTNAGRMAWYWRQYIGTAQPGGPLWAPLTADPTGLPPAHIITAEYDVLRDEGEAYADRLRAAGIEATVQRYPRMIHGFLTLVPNHEASIAAMNGSLSALRKAFASPDCEPGPLRDQ